MNCSPAIAPQPRHARHRDLFSPATMMKFSKMTIVSTKAQRIHPCGEDTSSFTHRLLSTRTEGVTPMDCCPARQVKSTITDLGNYHSRAHHSSIRCEKISSSTGRRTPSPVRLTTAPPRTPTRHKRIATNSPRPSTPNGSQANSLLFPTTPTIASDDNWTVWEDPDLLNKFDPTACGESWVWDGPSSDTSAKQSNVLELVKKFALPWTSKAATKRMREEDTVTENAPQKPSNPSSKLNSENAQREHTVTSKYRLEAFLVRGKADNLQLRSAAGEKTLTLRPLGERKLPETEIIAHKRTLKIRPIASTKTTETGVVPSQSLSLRKSMATKYLTTGRTDNTNVSPSLLRKSASKLNLFQTPRKGSSGTMQIESEIGALSPIQPFNPPVSADSDLDFGTLSPIVPMAPPASVACTPTRFARMFSYIPAAIAEPPLLEEICTELQALADGAGHKLGDGVERKRRKVSNVA
ncbi:hypothetical protein BJ742DRAFT_891800 [Cladochytrium replicatum]|nr:hypothetical protein BJ742DRAFT_891800 [Cladochytrium replicatum]